MLKRIISLFIVLVLGLSVCFVPPVSAASVSEQQLIFDLGIMPERDAYGLVSIGFTRRSFAHVIAKMNQAEYAGEITKESMIAVAPDIMRYVSWGRGTDGKDYAYIKDYDGAKDMMYAVTMGYMQTDEEGNFNPKIGITKNDALISLVKVLGYDEVVKANGGTEAAYLNQASKLGLLKGVKIADDTKLSYDEVCKIVANAMGAPFISYSSISGTPSCLWELWGISTGKGVIEANSNIGIGVSKTNANHVRINGTILYSRVEVPDALVGSQVTYYTVSEGENNEIVSLYAENTEESITLDADEIESVSDKGSHLEIIYEDDEELSVDKQGYLMINGKVHTPTKALFDLFDCGSATFLDTDEDGTYDVIHMTVLYQVVVEGVNVEKKSLRTKFEKQTIDFSRVDVLEVYDGNQSAEFSKIQVGMVAGIACDAFTISNNKITWDFAKAEYVRIYLSRSSEIGMIDAISDDGTFSIEGSAKEYGSGYERLTNGGLLPELKLSYYVKAFYDNQGKLTYYEMATGSKAMSYGYLVAGDVDGISIRRVTKLKILQTDGTIMTYDTSPKFILDGATVNTGSITYSVNGVNDVDLSKRQLVRYRVIDGVVREIDTVTVRGSIEDETTSLDVALAFDPTVEDGSVRTLNTGAIDRQYAFTEDAVVFVDEAPISESNPSEQLFSVVKASNMANGDYYIAGFDANEYNEMACAVRYAAYGSAAGEDSQYGLYVEDMCYVVGDIWNTIDENGELGWKISVVGDREQKVIYVPQTNLKLYSIDFEKGPEYNGGYFTVYRKPTETLESIIHSGDIIRFLTNSRGEVTYLEKMFDFTPYKNPAVNLPNNNIPYQSGTSFGFAELEKTNGTNIIYGYGASGDGTTYISRSVAKRTVYPVYYVKTGKLEMLPLAEVPTAATGNKVRVFIRYYNYGKVTDNIFYVYD